MASNCSYIWRSLFWSRDLFQKGTLWRVGEGSQLKVFKDAWVPSLKNGNLVMGGERGDNLKVGELILGTKQWDVEHLRKLLLPYEVSAVLDIELNKWRASDKRFWIHEEQGSYTVRSGYRVEIGLFSSHPSCSSLVDGKWWKQFWLLKAPPKVRIFSWRFFHGLIPVDMQLWKRHIPVSGICGWCKTDWGTIDHALFFCEKVKPAWKEIKFWPSLKRCKGQDHQAIMLFCWKNFKRCDFVEWLILLWMVWMELCRAKHEERPVMCLGLGVGARSFKEQFDQTQVLLACSNPGSCKPGEIRWKPPAKGEYRVDVDAHFNPKSGTYGVGIIVRDDEGIIQIAWAKPIKKVKSVLEAKLVAMLYGIGICLEKGLTPMHVCSDSLLLIRTLRNIEKEAGALKENFEELRTLYSQGYISTFSHCRWSEVQCAHILASFWGNISEPCLWTEHFPSWLASCAANDI